MHNRLQRTGTDFHSDGGWDIDQQPSTRLYALLGLLACALMVIATRLTYVQTQLGGRFIAEFNKTTERFEPIPSRDARLLAATGEVLAEDVERYTVAVHYRWLEEPSDPYWLKQQAWSRLERGERRKSKLVHAEIEALLAERDAAWQRLAALTETDPQHLKALRRAIQRRVEHRRQTIEESRSAQHTAATPTGDTPAAHPAPDWQDNLFSRLRKTLTTPPQRLAEEPLVIQEQLNYHPLLDDVSAEIAAEIESHPELFPGFRVELATRRVYPQGPRAAHLVGYRTAVDDRLLEERAAQFPNGDPLDYRTGDRIGRTGLERACERQLRGLRGLRKLTLDRRGVIIASDIVREPRHGRDVATTLLLPLQEAAEDLLDNVLSTPRSDSVSGKPLPLPRGGVIVALDVETGAILAAASGPGYDPNQIVAGDRDAWNGLLADERKPLFNRVTEMTVPPGSVFKVVSAIAYLETGQLDPEQTMVCQGYLDTPDRYRCYTFRNFGVGHGEVNFTDALARSCNVYFFATARRLGPVPMTTWASRLGFGQPTGVELAGERRGNLPRIEVGQRRPPRSSGDTLGLAIGQAQLTVTPLQTARLMTVVANGGRLVRPRLLDTPATETAGQGGSDESSRIPELSRNTLAWVRRGLEQVVAHPQGTGYKTVRLKDVAIAGKTGTAESGGGRPDHAWFAGYVPARQPKIAFVVVLEHAGSGGHAAGPVARQFVEAMQRLGLIGTSHLSHIQE